MSNEKQQASQAERSGAAASCQQAKDEEERDQI
jgi:hypothetical protein